MKYIIAGIVLGVVIVISAVAFVQSRRNNKILVDMRKASIDIGSRISSLANNGNQTIHQEVPESELPDDFFNSNNNTESARDPNKSSNNLMARTEDKHNGFDFYISRNKGKVDITKSTNPLELKNQAVSAGFSKPYHTGSKML